MKNSLYCGDNLSILREHIADESVDLIYLDPPFNSDEDYNVIFSEDTGQRSTTQKAVFEDTWSWHSPHVADVCREIEESDSRLGTVTRALHAFLGDSQMMAYLVMMAPRLTDLYRVLKPTGSLYLHCDSTASHYLKMLLDAVFTPLGYRNEIIWKRTNTHSDAKRWSPVSDTILYYAKGKPTWNPQYIPHSEKYLKAKYRYKDADGRAYMLDNMTSPKPRPNMMYEWRGYPSPPFGWRYSKETMAELDHQGRIWYPDSTSKRPRLKRYLEKSRGVLMGNVWTDIAPINSQAQERLNYPTQKPEALLERIVRASSNEGDIILDPFCGCGTAIQVGERLHREWIGIDVTMLATAIIKQRLAHEFGFQVFKKIELRGEPVSVSEAEALAREDKFAFQWWAVGRLGAPPIEQKKGRDRGADGRIYFRDELTGPAKHIVISVKAGEHVGPAAVRELRGVMTRDRASMGILVTVKQNTPEMRTEAGLAGSYKSLRGVFPALQIITVADIFSDEPLNIPGRINPLEPKRAARVEPPIAEQLRLLP